MDAIAATLLLIPALISEVAMNRANAFNHRHIRRMRGRPASSIGGSGRLHVQKKKNFQKQKIY
jgi:hypothetical protein